MADNINGETNGASDISACGEDLVSMEMRENNRTQVIEKKKNSLLKAFRQSFKKRGETNPLYPQNKEQNNKIKRTNSGNSDCSVQSPTSPVEGQFTKQGSGRWPLRFGSKKENKPKQENLEACREMISLEEEKSEVTEEKSKVWKVYVLPEIPSEPLSVMQINSFIKNNNLEEAYLNILSLRKEIQCEKEALSETTIPTELINKEKDLRLLHNNLQKKLTEIVQQSFSKSSCNKELLVQLACIMQEEEKREDDVGQIGGWRDAWRDAIQTGFKEELQKVDLLTAEKNVSWMAIHLGQVGKLIVEQLETVKTELTGCYPPSFNVFETFVLTCHKVVGEHLKELLEKVTEVRDYYALLDFVLNRYPSEKVMGSTSLQPEMEEGMKTLNLHDNFLDQIKNAYCDRVQVEVKTSLDNIIKLQYEEMWENKLEPMIDEGLYLSNIHMDILMTITGQIQASSMLEANLANRVMCCCLDELKEFPKRFESAFVQWNRTLSDPSLFAEYHISYMNSFRELKENIEKYSQKCPSQVEQLNKEINALVDLLHTSLLEHFKTETKPVLGMMMKKQWLSCDDDFQQLHKRIQTLFLQCKHMNSQFVQDFVSAVHYFVVKEYISQLMKNNYSCRNRKNEKAATKIEGQWGELSELFQEMNSVQHWLYPVGNHLQKIIGERKESDIKDYLSDLVDDYPDFTQNHLSAVLFFRGIKWGRQRQMILRKLSDLKQHASNAGSTQHVLFNEMEAAANTNCICFF